MKKELAGQRFGRLTALQKVRREGKSHSYWLCQCDCGNQTIVEESHLKSGHTKSCGCYRKERMHKRGRDLTGERYGRLLVLGPAKETDGAANGWQCRCDCGTICVRSKESLRSGTTRSCGCLQIQQRSLNMKKAIHFVDGTCVERIASRRTAANNTTGHRGVYRRENNRWRANIGFQGKSYHLGTFESYEEAVQARLAAEKRLYDTFLEEYKKK